MQARGTRADQGDAIEERRAKSRSLVKTHHQHWQPRGNAFLIGLSRRPTLQQRSEAPAELLTTVPAFFAPALWLYAHPSPRISEPPHCQATPPRHAKGPAARLKQISRGAKSRVWSSNSTTPSFNKLTLTTALLSGGWSSAVRPNWPPYFALCSLGVTLISSWPQCTASDPIPTFDFDPDAEALQELALRPPCCCNRSSGPWCRRHIPSAEVPSQPPLPEPMPPNPYGLATTMANKSRRYQRATTRRRS